MLEINLEQHIKLRARTEELMKVECIIIPMLNYYAMKIPDLDTRCR
jgi:hypothetical protein